MGSCARQPTLPDERSRRARLFAAVTEATDDVLTAVFDANYHAISRDSSPGSANGDMDGNEARRRDPAPRPFIATLMQPRVSVRSGIVASATGTGCKRRSALFANCRQHCSACL